MIGKLRGLVDAVGEEEAVIDVSGVGYLVHAGSKTLSRLEPGKEVTVHIETYVREDQFKLFGFLSEAERAWFVRLQSVQGVGAKHALAMLDAAGVGEIESAAALGDVSTFERAKGVGKKLAQRIATELKDKAPPLGRGLAAGAAGLNAALGTKPGKPAPAGAPPSTDAGAREAAVSALINLGYAETDARRAVAVALREAPEADEAKLIRAALKELAR
ncbi:MAG: Holliday junction branch migration protein RuvA [Oceanicaulis sp.]